MAFPLWSFVNAPPCGLAEKMHQKSKAMEVVFTSGTMAFDTCASLTCLIVGILGMVGVIGMSAGAAYALIGVSGGITLLWIALSVSRCSGLL